MKPDQNPSATSIPPFGEKETFFHELAKAEESIRVYQESAEHERIAEKIAEKILSSDLKEISR